jgi:transposase InsO family protein
MVSPSARRRAAAYLVRRYKVSERRACSVVGQHRSTQRYRPLVPEDEARLVAAMNALAERYPRWGYRSIAKLLRDDGWPVNVKRIERLWRLEGHRLPPARLKESGKRADGVDANSSQNRPALAEHHIWSYDFVSAQVRRGGKVRILNVVDEFTRVSLGSKVSRSIGATAVIAHLEVLFDTHGTPSAIRSDNGREFIAASVVEWLEDHGVEPVFIAKASPQQNPFVERFNGTMRRDLLNIEEFNNVLEAQVLVDMFNREYNEERPHRGLNMMTPLAFAESHRVVAK